MSSSPPVHPAAAEGYTWAANAYERGRPEYPEAAVDRLLEQLGIQTGSQVLDLAAGTGKFTKLLAPLGCRITAVEPVDSMREKLAAAVSGARVLAGTAEAIPLPDHSMDAVIVATAFHWFDGPKALAEIHRVLRPGGKLGLVWNVRDDSVGWVAELTRIMDPYQGSAPRYREGAWKKAFRGTRLFTPLQEEHFSFMQEGPPSMVVDRVMSVSFISALPEAERLKVRAEVESLLSVHPALKGRETVKLPGRTDVFWCSKVSS